MHERLDEDALVLLPLIVAQVEAMAHAREQQRGVPVHLLGASGQLKPRVIRVIHLNGHINRDAAQVVDETLDAVEAHDCGMRDGCPGKLVHRAHGTADTAKVVGRIDLLRSVALQLDLGVARDGEHRELAAKRVDPHEDHRIGTRGRLALAGIGTKRQHVIGHARHVPGQFLRKAGALLMGERDGAVYGGAHHHVQREERHEEHDQRMRATPGSARLLALCALGAPALPCNGALALALVAALLAQHAPHGNAQPAALADHRAARGAFLPLRGTSMHDLAIAEVAVGAGGWRLRPAGIVGLAPRRTSPRAPLGLKLGLFLLQGLGQRIRLEVVAREFLSLLHRCLRGGVCPVSAPAQALEIVHTSLRP